MFRSQTVSGNMSGRNIGSNIGSNRATQSNSKGQVVKSPKTKTLVLTVFSALLLTTLNGFAQSANVKKQCRSQAKEAAMELSKLTYSQCMNLAKEDEAAYLKQEYKSKVAKLKKFYQEKIKKLEVAIAAKATDSDKSTTPSSDSKKLAIAPTTETPVISENGVPSKSQTPQDISKTMEAAKSSSSPASSPSLSSSPSGESIQAESFPTLKEAFQDKSLQNPVATETPTPVNESPVSNDIGMPVSL